ncbi:MAG: PAS domain S-box protein [Anaerolineales bacterium]|nr:PAS domain S-box protein [Anaerolineales bacterium]
MDEDVNVPSAFVSNEEISAEILNLIFTRSPDAIALVDEQGRILMANQSTAALLGFASGEDVVGQAVWGFIAHQHHQRAQQDMQDTFSQDGIRRFEYPIAHRQGGQFQVEMTAIPLRNIPGLPLSLLVIARDISERRKTEMAILTLLEKSLQGVIMIQNRQITYCNQVASEILGYPPEELLGLHAKETSRLIHPDDFPLFRTRLQARQENIEDPIRLQLRIRRKNGEIRHLNVASVGSLYNDLPALQITFLDLTEQRQAEEGWREMLTRYQALGEAAQDAIYILDREGQILYINSYCAEMLGTTPERATGRRRCDYIPDTYGQKVLEARQQVFETGAPVQVDDQLPTIKGLRWFSARFVPLRDSSGEVTRVLGVSRDIDDRKHMELELVQATHDLEQHVAERTAELVVSQKQLKLLTRRVVNAQEEERRRIARELHDEAGQALISLKMGLLAMLEEMPPGHPQPGLLKTFEMIDQTTERIRSLAHSLRPPVLDIAGVNLSLKEYCREFSERVRIEVHYQGTDLPGLPEEISISLFRFLQEGLTNVAKHASAQVAQVDLEYQDGEIRLSVRDDGCGFDPAVPAAGIGLLGMRERLAILRGSLQIDSRPGEGTLLSARIPWQGSGSP